MKSFSLLLIIALSLPACARFSETTRQQRAYEKYVRKSMTARKRQLAHLPKNKTMEVPPLDMGPWQATMTSETEHPVEAEPMDH
jgi:hypothetical protein